MTKINPMRLRSESQFPDKVRIRKFLWDDIKRHMDIWGIEDPNEAVTDLIRRGLSESMRNIPMLMPCWMLTSQDRYAMEMIIIDRKQRLQAGLDERYWY